jgi:major type 1 subunit fimbrin (pilin)
MRAASNVCATVQALAFRRAEPSLELASKGSTTNMRMFRLILATLAMTAAGSAFAGGDPLTLVFTGTFVPPTCTIDAGSQNQTVSLGSVALTSFAAVGSTANPTPFNVVLDNCTQGTKITMNVTGSADSKVLSVLQNTGGSATQVGVQILQAASSGATTGTALTLNSNVNLGVVSTPGSMTFPFVAQFYRLGTMTAGSVAATATVNFTYN